MKEIKLKNKRIERGLTQVEIAKRVDISTRHYQRLERGDNIPNVKIAQKLAKALDTTVEKLF